MSESMLLLVEDDLDLAEIIQYNLEQAGHKCKLFNDGLQAWSWLLNNKADLILLDLMLPGMDGLELLRKIRANRPDVFVILLTAKSDEIDRVVGLELGADDYITKPFSMRELLLRIKAILRRNTLPAEHTISAGELIIKQDLHQVLVSGREVALTSTEFDLLLFLAKRPGRVQSREHLLEQVWGYNSAGYARTVDTHMRRLRQKLGVVQDCLETVRGVGYRFNPNFNTP